MRFAWWSLLGLTLVREVIQQQILEYKSRITLLLRRSSCCLVERSLPCKNKRGEVTSRGGVGVTRGCSLAVRRNAPATQKRNKTTREIPGHPEPPVEFQINLMQQRQGVIRCCFV